MPSLRSPLLREIGAIYRSIQSIMELRFRNKQLQRGQFIFLTCICEHPGIKQVELTRMCRVDKGTTAKAVRKLMEAGYVLRKPDSRDGRAWNLFPTEKAGQVYKEILAEENRELEVCVRGMPAEEQRLLLGLIERVQNSVETDWLLFHEHKNPSDMRKETE